MTQMNNDTQFLTIRDAFKNYLTENHFAKKTLSGKGGVPPPPLMENRQKILSKTGQKELKLAFFGQK